MDERGPNLAKLGEMHRSPLTPVFAGLQLGLHVLVMALAGVVFLRALLDESDLTATIIALAVIFVAVYLFGGVAKRLRGNAARWWLAVLTLVWIATMAVSADAAYLAFGLFFLYLHILRRPLESSRRHRGNGCRRGRTGLHRGWTIAGASARSSALP